ncbi:MAG: MFS transporter [Bacillota bacterium]
MRDASERGLTSLPFLRAKPDFCRIWAGNVCSRFGDALDTIAFMWIILKLTGSTLMMGTLMVVNMLPSIVLGPFAGVLVDRWQRKQVMLICDAARGFLTVCIAFLWLSGDLAVWMLYAVTFANSVLEAFAQPARGAVIPLLAGRENLVAANSLYSFGESLATLFGLGVAGVVVSTLGITTAVAIDAVTFWVSALSVLVSRLPELARNVTPLNFRQFSHELGEGLTFVRQTEPVFLAILLAGLINIAVAPINVLTPVYVAEDLRLGATDLSHVYIALTLGSLLGAALVGSLGPKIHEVNLMRLGFVGVGASYALFYLARSKWPLVTLTGFLGFAVPFANTGFRTLLQRSTPKERMGRIQSLMGTLVLAAMPLSSGLSGFLGEHVPIPTLFGMLGIFVTLVAGTILWRRVFRRPETTTEALEGFQDTLGVGLDSQGPPLRLSGPGEA